MALSSSTAAAATTKISFTVRRPTPVSRQGSSGLDSDREGFKVPALPRHLSESGRSTPASPLGNGRSESKQTRRYYAVEKDSSDEEEEDLDEIVTGFDQFGVQRLKEKKKDEGPLVIPALANRDWREIARKRKAAEMFVPAAGAAKTGADGSVGGLGTKDTINSGPAVSGLVKMEKRVRMDVDEGDGTFTQSAVDSELAEARQETEDEKAMRALVASASGEQDADAELTIGAIPVGGDDWRPVDETDAFRRDVVTRPDVASLEDYERVPVEQFGAALLRGMGWKPGQAASRTRTGLVEPYLPSARPALLGIGAKERESLDDGSKMKKPTRPERRYVPLEKKEREGSGRDSDASSRRTSRPPDPDRRGGKDKDLNREKEKERDRNRDRVQVRDTDRERDYEDRRRDRDRDFASDRDRRDRRKDRDYESDRDRDREGRRDGDRRRDKDRDRDYDRDRRR